MKDTRKLLLTIIIIESLVIAGFVVSNLSEAISSDCVKLETEVYSEEYLNLAMETSGIYLYDWEALFNENGFFVGFLFRDTNTSKWLFVGTTEYPAIYQGE